MDGQTSGKLQKKKEKIEEGKRKATVRLNFWLNICVFVKIYYEVPYYFDSSEQLDFSLEAYYSFIKYVMQITFFCLVQRYIFVYRVRCVFHFCCCCSKYTFFLEKWKLELSFSCVAKQKLFLVKRPILFCCFRLWTESYRCFLHEWRRGVKT